MAEEPQIRFLGDVQRLTLSPGDILVIKCGFRPTADQMVAVRDHVQRIFGEQQKVMVLDMDMELGVLSPSAT